jgi:hypothetical protein
MTDTHSNLQRKKNRGLVAQLIPARDLRRPSLLQNARTLRHDISVLDVNMDFRLEACQSEQAVFCSFSLPSEETCWQQTLASLKRL